MGNGIGPETGRNPIASAFGEFKAVVGVEGDDPVEGKFLDLSHPDRELNAIELALPPSKSKKLRRFRCIPNELDE